MIGYRVESCLRVESCIKNTERILNLAGKTCEICFFKGFVGKNVQIREVLAGYRSVIDGLDVLRRAYKYRNNTGIGIGRMELNGRIGKEVRISFIRVPKVERLSLVIGVLLLFLGQSVVLMAYI